MADPPFLRFRPVPLRPRHDGWTPALQFDLIVLLARGIRPGEAAKRLGMSRQSAYALRTHPGGDDFTRAWDEALAFARQVRILRARGAVAAATADRQDEIYKPDRAPPQVSASQASHPRCRDAGHAAKGGRC
jgi:hypothetical protein